MHLLLILAASLVCFVQSVQAQEVIKAASFAPQGSPVAQGLEAFAESLQACTNDQIVVEVFSDGSLGTPSELAEQVANGNIDLAVLPASALQEFSMSTGILSAPFIFYNRRHWETALNGPAIEAIDNDLNASAGLRVLGFMGGEQYGILSKSAITALEDLEGRNIRVAGIDENAFRALGANPRQTAFAEVYSALQTGAIDATEATADFVVRGKIFETASEFTISNHRIFTDLMIMSSESINALSDETRLCVDEAADTASKIGRDAVAFSEQTALGELAAVGVDLHKIANRPALFERASGATSEIIDRLQADELYSVIMSSFTCPTWCDNSYCDDDECKACKECE